MYSFSIQTFGACFFLVGNIPCLRIGSLSTTALPVKNLPLLSVSRRFSSSSRVPAILSEHRAFSYRRYTSLSRLYFSAENKADIMSSKVESKLQKGVSLDYASSDILENFIDALQLSHEESRKATEALNAVVNESIPSTHAQRSPTIVEAVRVTADELCQIGADTSKKRKAAWQDLQEMSQRLLVTGLNEYNTVAISCIFAVLALTTSDGAKAAASALATTVSRHKQASQDISVRSFRCFLMLTKMRGVQWNWSTVTQFARAFRIENIESIGDLLVEVITMELDRAEAFEGDWTKQKPIVSGILALVTQVQPWSTGLSPLKLVQTAVPLDYWHVAEQICQSHPSPESAVMFLIDASLEDHTYRRADQLASNLYEKGGYRLFLEARFQHSCDTISKVVFKRQLPIIERQVVRIEKAVERVRLDPRKTVDASVDDVTQNVRMFALTRLDEAGEHDAAHRLATLWQMDYVYDEEAMAIAAEKRREKYLQFEEALPGEVPDLISDPNDLEIAFKRFWKDGPYPQGPFGLDAEWEADVEGVDILQLSHPKAALLIDIPSMLAKPNGALALEKTVGAMFDSSSTIVAGFACRQDLSRLRKGSWLKGASAVVDLQALVVRNVPELGAVSSGIGLSRVCAHFFGKPLDKSEQCSFWGARPLSERQRVYATLDAWVCAAVYEKQFMQ